MFESNISEPIFVEESDNTEFPEFDQHIIGQVTVAIKDGVLTKYIPSGWSSTDIQKWEFEYKEELDKIRKLKSKR